MWFQVYTIVILFLELNQNTHAKSRSANKRNIDEVTKIHQLLFATTSGIELCNTESKRIYATQLEAGFKAALLCRPFSNALATIIMQPQQGHRSVFVTFLNKKKWQACQKRRCFVKHRCTSLDKRDCTAFKRKKIARKRKHAAIHHIALKEIKYIAASSRYRDVIIGIGTQIRRHLFLLTFNTTDDFAQRQLKFSLQIPGEKTAGLTTGPCYTGQDVCVYVCYRLLTNHFRFKLVVFKEPDTDQTLHMMDKYVDVSTMRMSVISIAVDGNCTLYLLQVQGLVTNIKIIHMSDNGYGHLHKRVIKKIVTLLKPMSLDVTKEGNQILMTVKNQLYLLASKTFPGTRTLVISNMQNLNRNKRQNNIICFLKNGKSIALINKRRPYKGTKLSLFIK